MVLLITEKLFKYNSLLTRIWGGAEGQCPPSENQIEIMPPITLTNFAQWCRNKTPGKRGVFTQFRIFPFFTGGWYNYSENWREKSRNFKGTSRKLKKLTIRPINVSLLWKHRIFYFLCQYKFLPCKLGRRIYWIIIISSFMARKLIDYVYFKALRNKGHI